MITKIEIDGFKTFKDFQMEFSPLTVIVGANASGKSNLFDALQLLSRLAETDIKNAFSEQRGEATELFTQYGNGEYAKEMKFAVEMLVDKIVRDNWGGEAQLKYTRLRYEITIRRVTNDKGLDDLIAIREHLEPLRHKEDTWVKKYIPRQYLEYWRPKVDAGRRSIPYILTEERNGVPTTVVPQDGRTGNKREFPATTASQTVLGGFNSVDFRHILAAREEMRSWKFLQLSPETLRRPSPYLAKDIVTQTGENLAASLYRIKMSDESALKDISRELNAFLPSLVAVDVYDDKAAKQFVITVRSEDGREFTSRVLSEGTLRLLTLCVLQYDEHHRGLLCFEEPENGIHPYRFEAMVKLLQGLSADFSETEWPLRQVVVNTHSPVLVGQTFKLNNDKVVSIWFSRLVKYVGDIDGKKESLLTTRMTAVVRDPDQFALEFTEYERRLTLSDLTRYLNLADFGQYQSI